MTTRRRFDWRPTVGLLAVILALALGEGLTGGGPQPAAFVDPARTVIDLTEPVTTTSVPAPTTTAVAVETSSTVITAPPATAPPAPPPLFTGYYGQTNATRTEHGLTAVAWSEPLAAQAQAKAASLAAQGWECFAGDRVHYGLDAALASVPIRDLYSGISENVGCIAPAWRGAEFQALWLASPSHRANLLDPRHTHTAWAHAVDAHGTLWVVVWFGDAK